MISVCEPQISEKEKQYVMECLDTGWISSAGHFITDFEQAWAKYCGMKYGVAVCNGTVALEAAVACMDLEPGDEIIMPSFTIISCAMAVVAAGGIPVLVDCEPDTWTMRVDQIEAKITPRTRGIMPVHIYGHPVDMDPILELAKKYGLMIIEDAAEAHGAEYKGKKCGSFGDMACFSFYANKIVTTGEGGMVLTNDAELAAKLKDYRNLCFKPDQRFLHDKLGKNYRMTNIQAAIGLAQVEKIEETVNKKRWLAGEYQKRLVNIPGLQLPVEKEWAKNVYWMYGIVLPDNHPLEATDLARALKEKGIETRPFFLGMHEQPVFHAMKLYLDDKYPISESLARKGLYLPSGPKLTIADIDTICFSLISNLS
jgi:perosamine synthetase